MLVVVIVLLLADRSAPYTFTGGTESGLFTCHCSPDVQCDDDTGACPGDVCGISGQFAWGNIACQHGNVALLGGNADQTGSGNHVAGGIIDGDRNNALPQGSCCNPGRSSSELFWIVNLGGTFAISVVAIYTAVGNDRNTISGVEVYVSASRTPTNSELCGVQSGSFQDSTTVRCATMMGRYVTIRQPDVSIEEMVFCEVQVHGYQYHSCGFYDGDYRYGPGCVMNCHCQHQCDVITGVCHGVCSSGWRKVNGACALTCSSGYWGVNCESDCHCASHNRACDGVTGACDADCDSGYSGFNCQTCDDRHWGSNCAHECHCDSITSDCDGVCDPGYYGARCNIVKPSLRNATITFIEDQDVIIITITDIEYMTELVREYLVQYKLLHEDNLISISINPMSGRKRREVGDDNVVLQFPFSNQSINSQYEFALVPLISSPEYNSVVGVSSEFIPYNSGCLQYTGLPSCNHWCVCSGDPGTLCLLTCDYCHVCDSDPELPSRKTVNFKITDITTVSMRIQFKDAQPDLPFTLTFLTRLGDHYANISSWVGKADYTYISLSPNTVYDIEVTAVLEDGVLSKSWTLTATTLTESSDDTLHIVIGCVVSVAGIVVLLIIIGIILKRRKARQSQEEVPQHSLEPYDYIDERSIGTFTELSNNGYLTPVETPSDDNSESVVTPNNGNLDSVVTPTDCNLDSAVTPGEGSEPLDTHTRENNKLYENEDGEYTTIGETAHGAE